MNKTIYVVVKHCNDCGKVVLVSEEIAKSGMKIQCKDCKEKDG